MGKAFRKLIFDQTIVHGRVLANQVPEYERLMKEIERLFVELKGKLPDEVSERLWNQAGVRVLDCMYCRARESYQ